MSTQEAPRQGSGWITFAAIVLLSFGFLRIITAIYYFAESDNINDLTNGAFGDNLWLWGLWDLCIAGVALFAGWSLLSNNTFGRVVAYIWAILVIIQGFMIFAWAPWFAAAAITLAALVIYGLAKTAAEEEV
jgi:hypothetical protein